MKIAIVGAGNVGGTLAKKLGSKGHSIYLGVKDPKSEEANNLVKGIGLHASAHSVQEAVSQAEIVLLATPWGVTEDVVKSFADLVK
ncbi:MAG: NAD(P)-binding domain-containing protein, partial [Pseudobdellovibrionaceae bacterium]